MQRRTARIALLIANMTLTGCGSTPPPDDPASLSIVVAPAEAEAAVLVDGVERGTAPLRLSDLPYGEHVVEARAPGYETASRTVVLTGGVMTELELELQPATEMVPVTNTPNGMLPVGTPPPDQNVVILTE